MEKALRIIGRSGRGSNGCLSSSGPPQAAAGSTVDGSLYCAAAEALRATRWRTTVGGLVTWGPYRYIRHPIYTAVCLFGWAGIAAHASAASVALGVVMLAGGLTRMLSEERLVSAIYPEYGEYAKRTKRMIPFVF